MDPLSALLAGLGALGLNLAAIGGAYVRIIERLTRLETQVAALIERDPHSRQADHV